RRALGAGAAIAAHVRARIRAETGLTASVGVARTKLLAKLASEEAKPDGLLVVKSGTELEFLHPLDVGRLWGVGPATRRRLAPLGIRPVSDLVAVEEAVLIGLLGPAAGTHLHALAWNRDQRPVVGDHEVKSVGHEETFAVDLTARVELERELVRLADRVA